jgi:cation transport ATPase
LSDEEALDLKRALDRFVALTGERSMMLNQLSKFDNSLVEMFTLEEDATVAIPQIKDAEKHQRALRQDIGYLRGEKEELSDERDDMSQKMVFIKHFSLGMVILFAIASMVLMYLYIANGFEIFFPIAILIMMVMAIVIILYMFRQRLRREMRYNMRKQHRAVSLLNKKSIVFAYYTNYLRYSYNKYKVKSSRTLENNLNDFESYKYLVNRIDTVRALMYETEEYIEQFLREKKLTGVKATIENFARTINLEDKRRYYAEVDREKQKAEKDLIEMDARHEEIWNTLSDLREYDLTKDKIVETIMATYLTEASKLFDLNDEKPKPEATPDLVLNTEETT